MKNRRSIINYSIKREMQIRLLIKVMLVSLIGIIMVSAVFYFYSNIKIEGTYRQFHIHAKNFLDYLLPVVIAAGVLGVIFAAFFAAFFPHSIAGPLHRMERVLKDDVGEGNFTVRFHPRKGDEVKELADALNAMVEKLNLKMKEMDKIFSALEVLIMGLTEGEKIGRLTPEEKEKLAGITKELRTSIKQFKVH